MRLALQSFVARLATAEIGATHNQYTESAVRRSRLLWYLEARAGAPLLLAGEAAGHRGARISGIPFTSERQLTGVGPAEVTATIMRRVLTELGLEEDVLLWNVVPTHPHRPDRPDTNRRPTRSETDAGLPFLEQLAVGRLVVAVGRLAESVLGRPAVRHPSHGGARAFRAGLVQLLGRLS